MSQKSPSSLDHQSSTNFPDFSGTKFTYSPKNIPRDFSNVFILLDVSTNLCTTIWLRIYGNCQVKFIILSGKLNFTCIFTINVCPYFEPPIQSSFNVLQGYTTNSFFRNPTIYEQIKCYITFCYTHLYCQTFI